uniref:SET domain-containing protein n=1 Tax=Caenorhabditis tropicalis TaxID=1561998 RepID=A0A1I7TK89_9PELO
MQGASEVQQPPRYRYTPRNEEQNQQPTTSSSSVARLPPIQASLICTPTTTTSSLAPSSSGSSNGQRSQPTIMRLGKPIKIGDSILEPAGTLVFAQNDSPTWASGQRIIVGNKHAVVQANLFPIGPPVLTVQPPTNFAAGNWMINQQSATTSSNSVSLNAHPSATTSSATPDSGIQSVPTSPPSPSFELMNDREADTFDNEDPGDDDDDDEPADFTDMPRLKPIDEDDECYDVASTSFGPPLTDVHTRATTSSPVHSTTTLIPAREELPTEMNAEEFVSFSIASNMNLDEIVSRLYSLDPDKANSIAVLIKKKYAEESRKKKDMEAEVSSTTPTTPRTRFTRKRNKGASRTTNSPDVTTSNLPEEPSTSTVALTEEPGDTSGVRKRGRRPKKKRPIQKEQQQDEVSAKKFKTSADTQIEQIADEDTTTPPEEEKVFEKTVTPVQFRLKVREMMERQLETLTQKMSVDMMELRLSHSTSTKITTGKRKESFFRQLNEQSKKLRKSGVSVSKKMKTFSTESILAKTGVKNEICQEAKEESVPTKMRSSRRSRVDDSPEDSLAPVEEKFNGEYHEISRSVPFSESVIPLWRAPSLNCGCTKGACTSDLECLNRALRVQCSNECTLSYCSNRRFWKEDCSSKLTMSSGPKSRRVLKTKMGRKSGDFLCEFAGEVIDHKRAYEQFKENQEARIVAIGSQLFIDATNRGNLARFIKHSCKPNSRLEVWSVNGFYRAGVFALVDLSPNAEVTIDKSGLLPFDVPCNCGAFQCKKIIRGVRKAVIVDADENEKFETRRFLPRNRRKTIQKARESGLPAILLCDKNSSLLSKMRKTLAAFSFRVQRIDGSIPRSMLPYYSAINNYLKINRQNLDSTIFVALFQNWLEVINDDDLERAFITINSHYLSSSVILSAQQTAKTDDTSLKARATLSSCHSSVLPKRGEADLSYLESLHPIGSYDPDDAWESYRATAKDNAVRCICGALDEDGEMVQCDKCFFWLHMDCCESVSEEDEFNCDFCLGKQAGQRPNVDVRLHEQPEVRFESCVYYRSLMNRRGIQIRLNETVYVNRSFNEDHKNLLKNLREEKPGLIPREPNMFKFPKAPTEPLPKLNVNRKNARIFRVERLFVCPGNNRYVFGSFYAWPHETFADTGRVFCRQEVFSTSYYETLPLDEVIGRCLVVDGKTWSEGRPKVPKFKEDDVFFCDQQIGRNQRVFEKIPPKYKYPINKKPYVFTRFTHPKKIVKDLRPYCPTSSSPKPPKSQPINSTATVTTSSVPSFSSKPIPSVDLKSLSQRNMDSVLIRLKKSDS